MNSSIVNDFYDSLTTNYYRSIIVDNDEADVTDNSHLYDITHLGNNSYYLTLTFEGVNSVLNHHNLEGKDKEKVLKLVEDKEKEQKSALVDYLKLERELKSNVVFVMLRDGRVSTDADLFKDTYSLPLDVFFNSLLSSGFKLVSTDTLRPECEIRNTNYGDFLFANKNYDKLLSAFIDVSVN